MSNGLSKLVLESLLPEGSIWNYKPGAGLDQTLDGIASCDDDIIADMAGLADIRNPQKTPILDDLEYEFGIVKNNNFSEQQRRNLLEIAKTNRQSDGTWLFLQNILRASGFDVYVHPNDPPVNPDFFVLGAQPLVVCDNADAVCDNENAVCDAYGGIVVEEWVNYFGNPNSYFGNEKSYFGAFDEVAGFTGEVLVNQDFYNYEKNYLIVCDNENAVCDNENVVIDAYNTLIKNPIKYTIPVNSGYWPLVFFVGGPATRDPNTGAITAIQIANVPLERRDEFRGLILKIKPMYSWAVLVVKYF